VKFFQFNYAIKKGISYTQAYTVFFGDQKKKLKKKCAVNWVHSSGNKILGDNAHQLTKLLLEECKNCILAFVFEVKKIQRLTRPNCWHLFSIGII
jgi:hypothetical protein